MERRRIEDGGAERRRGEEGRRKGVPRRGGEEISKREGEE